MSKLGPEAIDPESFTSDYIVKKTSGKSSTIKEFLLDQNNVCGIGNIYAD